MKRDEVMGTLDAMQNKLWDMFGSKVSEGRWDYIIDTCEEMTAELVPEFEALGIEDDKGLTKFCCLMEDVMASLMYMLGAVDDLTPEEWKAASEAAYGKRDVKSAILLIDGKAVDLTKHIWGLWECCNTSGFIAKNELADMESGKLPVDEALMSTDREMIQASAFVSDLLEPLLDDEEE